MCAADTTPSAGTPAAAPTPTVFDRIAASGEALKIGLGQVETATLASQLRLTSDQLEAVAAVLDHAAAEKHRATVQTLTNLGRLSSKAPKTFANFDFSRVQGEFHEALTTLPTLSDLYARNNLAFIGPSGVGKSHLAEAYARECCERGMTAYMVTARELRAKFRKAIEAGGTDKAVAELVKKTCLVVDEIGHCAFDLECTELFYDVVSRRHKKDGPNTMILVSNVAPSKWGEYFTGDDALIDSLDRAFDRASVFMIKGASYRGSGLRTFTFETVPAAQSAGDRPTKA